MATPKRALAATLAGLLAVTLTAAAATGASAGTTSSESRPDVTVQARHTGSIAAEAEAEDPQARVGPTAWTPQIYPLFSGEWVQRNVSSADRNTALALCAAADGIACVSVGQGDGRHSVFHLYKCDTRSLSNFIDALAVLNNQTGGAQVHFWGPRYQVYIPADDRIHTVPDYATYDFNRLDIC